MERSTEKQTGFLGTYFDREAVMRLSRFAGVLAWITLGLYVYTTLISMGQTWYMLTSTEISFEGANIFDRLSMPGMHLSQMIPGLLYFTLLKTAQQVLLILLDVEDNSRRAARK